MAYAVCKYCKLNRFRVVTDDVRETVETTTWLHGPVTKKEVRRTKLLRIECDNCGSLYLELAQA